MIIAFKFKYIDTLKDNEMLQKSITKVYETLIKKIPKFILGMCLRVNMRNGKNIILNMTTN